MTELPEETVDEPGGRDGAVGSAPVTVDIPVRFRDVDGMGHVNNAVFSTYLETARIEYWHRLFPDELDLSQVEMILARAEIDFRGQIRFPGTVRVSARCPRIGTKSFDLAYRVGPAAGGELYAEARTVQVAYDYRTGRTVPVSDELRRRIETLEGRSL
ncbi:MAG: acyl-CoA thioesterase [Thermoanaerobaculia bacterium]